MGGLWTLEVGNPSRLWAAGRLGIIWSCDIPVATTTRLCRDRNVATPLRFELPSGLAGAAHDGSSPALEDERSQHTLWCLRRRTMKPDARNVTAPCKGPDPGGSGHFGGPCG